MYAHGIEGDAPTILKPDLNRYRTTSVGGHQLVTSVQPSQGTWTQVPGKKRGGQECPDKGTARYRHVPPLYSLNGASRLKRGGCERGEGVGSLGIELRADHNVLSLRPVGRDSGGFFDG